jgi:hypothetical protein
MAAAVASCLAIRAPAQGAWSALASNAPINVGTLLLLSDGTVMAQNGGGTNWYKLSPDAQGHYVNGQWMQLHAMNYSRLYHSSAVLQDGRVFVAGGEYGTGTTNAEVYDPQSDWWTIIPLPSGLITTNNMLAPNNANLAGFADAGCITLSNGNVLVSPVFPAQYGGTVIFNPKSNSLSAGPLLQNAGDTDEGTFVKLPDDSILTIDRQSTESERYIPSLNQWVNDGTVPVPLYDSFGGELGPAFLLPNGKAFFIGSTTNTAFYTPNGTANPGVWSLGPVITNGLGAPDAPGAMMFNGKVLCALSPTPYRLQGTNYVATSPTYFYEYDYSIGALGTFTQVPAPGGGMSLNGVTFSDRMLNLPDGNILFTSGGSQLYVYQPDGSAPATSKPTISSLRWNPDGSLHLTGTQFSGISQGSSYGDDAQMDSNYPIVKFTSAGGLVYYGRSYNWSSTSVMTGGKAVTTEASVPDDVFHSAAAYLLQVVVNGIASDPITFFGPVWVDFNYTGSTQNGNFDTPYKTLAAGTNAVVSGGLVVIKSSASHETMAIAKPLTIVAYDGPATIGR